MKFKIKYLFFVCVFVLALCSRGFAQESAIHDLTFEIHAVSIVLNDEHRTGVDWEAIVSDFHALPLKNEDDSTVADKKYKLSVGTVSNEDYAVLIDALDTVGTMTQYKQPDITLKVEEKQSVNINVVDNKMVNNMRLDLFFKNSAQGNPIVNLEPYIGALKVQTQMPVLDHSTIVVGGIISEQEITKTHKFPLLGSLPFVGFVFRSQGKLMQRIETIIFVTPRINAIPETSS